VAGGTDPASTVPAGAGQYHYRHRRPLIAELLDDGERQVASGIFHHLKEIRTQFLDCHTIDLAHLRRRDSRHLYSGRRHE
jgi:hypothetical protein